MSRNGRVLWKDVIPRVVNTGETDSLVASFTCRIDSGLQFLVGRDAIVHQIFGRTVQLIGHVPDVASNAIILILHDGLLYTFFKKQAPQSSTSLVFTLRPTVHVPLLVMRSSTGEVGPVAFLGALSVRGNG